MQKRFLYIASLIFISASCIVAQDVSFTTSAPKYVRVGEQFQVQYSVNKNIDDFTPPSFDDFDFLGGPMQGSSTNISYVNGKSTRVQTFTFTYYLRAKQPGKFTLQPAQAVYKKSEISSNSVQIEVVGNSTTSSSTSQTQSGNTAASPSAGSSGGSDLFVRLVTDKKSVYVGESITAWVKLYTKVSLSDIDYQNFDGPTYSSFYQVPVEIPRLRQLEQEKVGNDIYLTGIVEKVVLFPQKSGKITINPFDLTVYQQKQVRRQSNSVFDDFFGPSYRSVPVKLTSKPVTINVKSLPANKPAGFTGAVGSYKLRGSLNNNQVKTNDAVSFKITLSGTGNIKLIENLDYEMPATMQVYDPVVKTNVNKTGTSGSKTFEITAIPRHPGNIDIKPFKLVYFNPSSKSYKTIQTQPFKLQVERGEGDSNSVVISNLSKEDVELIGSDIRYIKPIEKLYKEGDYLVDKLLYKLAYIILLVLLIGFVVFKREQIKRNADQSKVKHRKASKLAVKRFKKAKEMLNQQKIDVFYEEVSKALWGYISDKLNIPQSSLSAENGKQALKGHNIDEALINELFDTISNCEFARYAPGAASKQPSDVYADAMKLVMKIEQGFK